MDIIIGVSFASVDPSKSNWNPTPIPIHKYKVYMKRTVGGAWVSGPTYNHINYTYNGHTISNFFISRLNPIDYAVNGPLTSNESFYIKIEHISSPDGTWYNTPSEITGSTAYYYNEGTNTNHGNWYTILKEDIIFSGSTTVILPFKIFSEASTSSTQTALVKLSKYSDFNIYTSGSTSFTVPVNTIEPGVARHMADNSVIINFPYNYGDVIYYEFNDIHNTYRGQTIVPVTGTPTTTTTAPPLIDNVIVLYAMQNGYETDIYIFSDYDTTSQMSIDYTLTYGGNTYYYNYTGYPLGDVVLVNTLSVVNVTLNVTYYSPHSDATYNYIV